MGIDYGSVRVGIAVSDPLRIIARAIAVVPNTPSLYTELKRLTQEYEIEKIVVGMPFTLKGEKGQKALEVDEFISHLRGVVDLEIVTCDERFTSQTAHDTLLMMGVRKKQRQSKGRIDSMAAALILQEYLNSEQR